MEYSLKRRKLQWDDLLKILEKVMGGFCNLLMPINKLFTRLLISKLQGRPKVNLCTIEHVQARPSRAYKSSGHTWPWERSRNQVGHLVNFIWLQMRLRVVRVGRRSLHTVSSPIYDCQIVNQPVKIKVSVL